MTQPVTILGAGIVGICTALSLAQRGVPVRVIDRGAPGQETSFGNAGVISPWSIIPQSLPGTWKQIPSLMFGANKALSVHPKAWPSMIPWGLAFLRKGSRAQVEATADAMETLCAPCIDLYRQHLSGTGFENLVADAMYVHAFRDGSRATLDAIDYDIRRQKGAELELVGRDELRRVEPTLGSDFEAAVLIKGQARAVSPGRIGGVLTEKARGLGVVFKRADIRHVERQDAGFRVVCDGESFEAERIILAMGAWSPEILKPLGYRVPLMAERGYHVEFPEPQIELTNSVMDVDAKCVASSMEGGLRFAGQAEFAPVDAPADAKKEAHLTRLARAAFPGLNTKQSRFWMGRRPSFPDSLPALGPVEGAPGLFANFGHSHYGLMMAPKSGEILADMLTDARSNLDASPFALARF